MGNGQLKPAYNVQIGVESEYIIGLGLFPNPTDTTTLPPFLDRVAEKSGHKVENIIADAGYASEENYTYLETHEQKAYIKPADYEEVDGEVPPSKKQYTATTTWWQHTVKTDLM